MTIPNYEASGAPGGGNMKSRVCIAAAIALAVSACGPSIRVTTTAAPNVSFAQLHRFRILTPPPRTAGRPLPDDPMLVNSISNQVLHTSITDAFVSRGYTLDPTAPDFTVAYYASAREKLDVMLWDYGYRGRWGGWYAGGPVEVSTYTEGTVIVDVIDAHTKELLWRGRGQAMTSSDPAEYQQHLRDAVQAIVRKFPMATHLASR
jgi:hypothetical protein